jgi:uncharacterized membrane protein YfcA
MSIFALIVTGWAAGFLGSLTGLGGSVLLLPALTLLFKVPFAHAAGAALLSVIATSSGAGSAYVHEHLTNIRIGVSLEVGTTLGALVGSLLAALVYTAGLQPILFVIFGLVLLGSAYMELRRSRRLGRPPQPDWSTKFFQLTGHYYDNVEKAHITYYGIRWGWGQLMMFFAGLASGLLGIGSGSLKVLALDGAMNLPAKVSTATSNFMIGVTAAVSALVYWRLGYIEPALAGPAVIGVLIGALSGTRLFPHLRASRIRRLFIICIGLLGLEMILRGAHVA